MKKQKYCSFFLCPFGYLKLIADEKSLLSIQLVTEIGEENTSPLLELCITQLEEYFMGERKVFDIPLKFEGTTFQTEVWNALLKIPYGTTVSYHEIAKWINRPKAVRAVGGAIHNNPFLIVVPCHRVIGTNGDLIGFACGLSRKKYLLNLEKKNVTKE